VPILRTNHVLRGVRVPRGRSVVEFRYEPAAHALGWKLAAFAAVLGVAWSAWSARSILGR
jgi:hypothetical protein